MRLRFVQSTDRPHVHCWSTQKLDEASGVWKTVTGSTSYTKDQAEEKFHQLQRSGGTFGDDEVLQEVTI